ncbi:hypothetical protein Tco_0672542 [Tanacetum coccineum]
MQRNNSHPGLINSRIYEKRSHDPYRRGKYRLDNVLSRLLGEVAAYSSVRRSRRKAFFIMENPTEGGTKTPDL